MENGKSRDKHNVEATLGGLLRSWLKLAKNHPETLIVSSSVDHSKTTVSRGTIAYEIKS